MLRAASEAEVRLRQLETLVVRSEAKLLHMWSSWSYSKLYSIGWICSRKLTCGSGITWQGSIVVYRAYTLNDVAVWLAIYYYCIQHLQTWGPLRRAITSPPWPQRYDAMPFTLLRYHTNIIFRWATSCTCMDSATDDMVPSTLDAGPDWTSSGHLRRASIATMGTTLWCNVIHVCTLPCQHHRSLSNVSDLYGQFQIWYGSIIR